VWQSDPTLACIRVGDPTQIFGVSVKAVVVQIRVKQSSSLQLVVAVVKDAASFHHTLGSGADGWVAFRGLVNVG
jgi:hypothetical protein